MSFTHGSSFFTDLMPAANLSISAVDGRVRALAMPVRPVLHPTFVFTNAFTVLRRVFAHEHERDEHGDYLYGNRPRHSFPPVKIRMCSYSRSRSRLALVNCNCTMSSMS